jgi:hypothetical protein
MGLTSHIVGGSSPRQLGSLMQRSRPGAKLLLAQSAASALHQMPGRDAWNLSSNNLACEKALHSQEKRPGRTGAAESKRPARTADFHHNSKAALLSCAALSTASMRLSCAALSTASMRHASAACQPARRGMHGIHKSCNSPRVTPHVKERT